jgi:hypothetical protein
VKKLSKVQKAFAVKVMKGKNDQQYAAGRVLVHTAQGMPPEGLTSDLWHARAPVGDTTQSRGRDLLLWECRELPVLGVPTTLASQSRCYLPQSYWPLARLNRESNAAVVSE